MKVLLAGESWITRSIHSKGFDYFASTSYEEGVGRLKSELLKRGIRLIHIPNHVAAIEFPSTIEELQQYDVILLSDIGANTLLLHPDTFLKCQPTPNRLKLIRRYVEEGGGFAMIGGYLSFAGFEGKARYHGTPIEDILPVKINPYDDRVEVPEGFQPTVVRPDHPILADIPLEWPTFLGYNKLVLKKNAELLLQYANDPILAVTAWGKGRTAAFASDCSPHWGSWEFVQWAHYGAFWHNLIRWLAGKT